MRIVYKIQSSAETLEIELDTSMCDDYCEAQVLLLELQKPKEERDLLGIYYRIAKKEFK